MTTPRTAEKDPKTATAPKPSRPTQKQPVTQKQSVARKPSETNKPSAPRKTRRPEAEGTGEAPERKSSAGVGGRTITLALPGLGEAATRAVSVTAGPVVTAGRALTARRGLPLYAGLGALAVMGAVEWPLAVGIGIGYAVLRTKGLPTRSTPSR
ncbi:hypothetical protein ACFZAR_33145 [Streptomyces sp. NPDC008222]|uniref:hypothetical protein n=1 Tax=Streptomyces sp. NPDC008222 TaxID=3364820 RepID=UPI0036E3CF74